MRHAARRLVSLETWPGMTASSAEAAQLVMLRLLWLQQQTHRAVRGRQREAAACSPGPAWRDYFSGSTACVFLMPRKLREDNLKALGDGLAYIEETGWIPAQVIRDCITRPGSVSDRYLTVWTMVTAIDDANGNDSARSVYRRMYVPLSNYTASGGNPARLSSWATHVSRAFAG
jgi:hypothetical protein